MSDIKNIHVGHLIKQAVNEREIPLSRICKFHNCTTEEIEKTYSAQTIETDKLLRWSKLLDYDFFRIYSQHLILYSPVSQSVKSVSDIGKFSSLPQFRKNIYTKEIIDFILNRIYTKKMTKTEAIERYRIPKTTLHKWMSKYTDVSKS